MISCGLTWPRGAREVGGERRLVHSHTCVQARLALRVQISPSQTQGPIAPNTVLDVLVTRTALPHIPADPSATWRSPPIFPCLYRATEAMGSHASPGENSAVQGAGGCEF